MMGHRSFHLHLRRLATAAFGLATLSCARGRGRDSITWQPPQQAAPSGGGAAPVFAAAPAGRLTLAWVAAPHGGSDGRLLVRPSLRDTAVAELRDSLGSLSIFGEVPPKIAYGPDGTLYAAYLVTKVVPGFRWPQNALRFASSRDGGMTWTPPTTVTGDRAFGSYDDHALHVAPDGAIYLSWLAESGPHDSHTWFARSTDGGRRWSTPTMIDLGRSCPCCRTTMASGPDGALYVAWRKIYLGKPGETEMRDIAVARSGDRGATWSSPVRVHADEWHVNHCPDAGPSLAVGPDGTVHIAWWSGKEGYAGVQYAQSHDAGRTFSTPVPLGVAQRSRAAHVQLAVGHGADAGMVAAAWDDGTRRVPQIVLRISYDGGRSFAPAEPLSAATSNAGFPVVSLRGDSVAVAWQERAIAAATADSAEKARKNPNDPATYVNRLGTMQVMVRVGVLQ